MMGDLVVFERISHVSLSTVLIDDELIVSGSVMLQYRV